MYFEIGKRGNPNSMILMPGKRFGNPNSMLLMPSGKRDMLLPRPNGLILGKRNPNSLFLGPLYRRAEEKRETDLDEFFTSRGKKSVLYVPVCKQKFSADDNSLSNYLDDDTYLIRLKTNAS